MYTITKKEIKSQESEWGNEYETITVKELLEMAVDLLQGKVATTEIYQEYQYFLTLEDEECDEDDLLAVKGTLEMLLQYIQLDEEDKEV